MTGKTLLAVAAILASNAALAHGSVVRMGTEGAYPPYNYIDDSGQVAGFERELGDELCRRARLNCEWVTNDWDSIIPNLVSGNYDVIMAGMSITDERDEVIDFTQNYTLPDPSAYLVTSFNADIKGGLIAAQVNTIQAGHIASSGAALIEFASPEETVAALRTGEADAVLADKSYLEPIADEDPALMLHPQEVLLGGGIGMGVRESDVVLKATFNAAIQSMKDDGTLNRLISKHLPSTTLF